MGSCIDELATWLVVATSAALQGQAHLFADDKDAAAALRSRSPSVPSFNEGLIHAHASEVPRRSGDQRSLTLGCGKRQQARIVISRMATFVRAAVWTSTGSAKWRSSMTAAKQDTDNDAEIFMQS